MKDLTLDKLIEKLQAVRKKVGKNMPLRIADGYDNALGILTVSIEENTGWEGEPKEPFVCLSIG